MRTFAAIDFLAEMIEGREITVADLDLIGQPGDDEGMLKWELLEDGLITADLNNRSAKVTVTGRGRKEYNYYSKLDRHNGQNQGP